MGGQTPCSRITQQQPSKACLDEVYTVSRPDRLVASALANELCCGTHEGAAIDVGQLHFVRTQAPLQDMSCLVGAWNNHYPSHSSC